MEMNLGYVSIALNIHKNSKATRRLTYKRYNKMEKTARLNKLKEITMLNLNGLHQILQYNITKGIKFYRVTSNLIPLATHPNVLDDWNYIDYFNNELKSIGNYIKKHNIRFDSHPNQFNVINSLNDQVVINTKRELLHQSKIFDYMGYKDAKMVIHINNKQGGKKKAIERFINNFKNFPNIITDKIILENEDKSYTAHDILKICQLLNIPMVLDIHHHKCYNNGDIDSIINDIFKTWDNESLPPKVHLSSPFSNNKFSKHADYIDPYDFIELIELCKTTNKNFDVMLECKKKDLALFKLINDIKILKPNWKWEGSKLIF